MFSSRAVLWLSLTALAQGASLFSASRNVGFVPGVHGPAASDTPVVVMLGKTNVGKSHLASLLIGDPNQEPLPQTERPITERSHLVDEKGLKHAHVQIKIGYNDGPIVWEECSIKFERNQLRFETQHHDSGKLTFPLSTVTSMLEDGQPKAIAGVQLKTRGQSLFNVYSAKYSESATTHGTDQPSYNMEARKWLGMSDRTPIVVVDTPGLGDGRGHALDTRHLENVAQILKGMNHQYGGVSRFYILTDEPRVSAKLSETILTYLEMFVGKEKKDLFHRGSEASIAEIKEWLKHVSIVFTKHDFTQDGGAANVSIADKTQSFNNELRKVLFGQQSTEALDVPIYFIDSVHACMIQPTFNNPALREVIRADDQAKYVAQLNRMEAEVNTWAAKSMKFKCADIVAPKSRGCEHDAHVQGEGRRQQQGKTDKTNANQAEQGHKRDEQGHKSATSSANAGTSAARGAASSAPAPPSAPYVAPKNTPPPSSGSGRTSAPSGGDGQYRLMWKSYQSVPGHTCGSNCGHKGHKVFKHLHCQDFSDSTLVNTRWEQMIDMWKDHTVYGTPRLLVRKSDLMAWSCGGDVNSMHQLHYAKFGSTASGSSGGAAPVSAPGACIAGVKPWRDIDDATNLRDINVKGRFDRWDGCHSDGCEWDGQRYRCDEDEAGGCSVM